MPTGPFSALGTWKVFEHDGSAPLSGADSKVVVEKATRKWIKYRRKCSRSDPYAERVHHGKVYRYGTRIYRVSIGGFQYIEANV